MTARLPRLVAITIATLAAAAALAAADAGIAALEAELDSLQSFSAAFTQQRFDEDGEWLETAEGRCDIERPGRFRWVYTEPYRQTIVADGTTLWIYDEDLEQVTVNALGASTAGSPAELLSTDIAVASRYLIERRDAHDGYDWFRLTPKAPASDYQRIDLGLVDGEVRAMRLRDNLGQTTLIEFDQVRRNVALDDTLFEFTPPPGVDVIEGAAP